MNNSSPDGPKRESVRGSPAEELLRPPTRPRENTTVVETTIGVLVWLLLWGFSLIVNFVSRLQEIVTNAFRGKPHE
jgi:hypothetical protein